MANKVRRICRICAFLTIFVVLFIRVSAIFQPIWLDWNNYYTISGFYEEPEDTIETVFLGSSVMINGINPTQLYQEYGISAYNLGTSGQPFLTSYYWLEEVWRLHSGSLKTAVVDVSLLRQDEQESRYHMALDGMKISDVKIRAALDYTEGDILQAMNYLIPFMTYHTRWNELTLDDLTKWSTDPVNGTRGYQMQTFTYLEAVSPSRSFDFNYVIEYDTVLPEEVVAGQLHEKSLHHLEMMQRFCSEHGIQLIFIKTPTSNWAPEWNAAVWEVANQYGVPFFDFNYSPLIDELDIIHFLDTTDSIHLNHVGATKLTSWMGEYLVKECGVNDVRGDERYAYMDAQMERYKRSVEVPFLLKSAAGIDEYLRYAANQDYTVFIAAQDEASKSLTDEQREAFRQLGLNKLADLAHRDSYLAVIENGNVLVEETLKNKELNGSIEPLTYSGYMCSTVPYYLISGGYSNGNIASCSIGGMEYAINGRGLNIVVFDNANGKLVDQTVFDTYSLSTRDVYEHNTLSDARNAASAEEFTEGCLLYKLRRYLDEKMGLTPETDDSPLREEDIGEGTLDGTPDQVMDGTMDLTPETDDSLLREEDIGEGTSDGIPDQVMDGTADLMPETDDGLTAMEDASEMIGQIGATK